MTTTHEAPTTATLDTDADILALVAVTVGAAIRDQLWAMFIGPDRRPYRLLMPIDGLPHRPDEQECEQIVSSLTAVLDTLGGGEFVLVRERTGSTGLHAIDLVWANALIAASGATETPLRAVFVSHDGGVSAIPQAALARPRERSVSRSAKSGGSPTLSEPARVSGSAPLSGSAREGRR